MRRGQHQVITILGTESTLASLIPCLEAIRKVVYNLRNFSMYQRIFLGVSNVVPNRLDECLKAPTSFPLLPQSSTLNSNRRKKRFL